MGVGAKRVKHVQRNLTSTTLQAILPKQVKKVESNGLIGARSMYISHVQCDLRLQAKLK